jgi:hypothetical protein
MKGGRHSRLTLHVNMGAGEALGREKVSAYLYAEA